MKKWTQNTQRRRQTNLSTVNIVVSAYTNVPLFVRNTFIAGSEAKTTKQMLVLCRKIKSSIFTALRWMQQSWQWVIFSDPHDPSPSPRSLHESIMTTYKSWWVHDYCLLFCAMWNSGYGLCSIIGLYTVSLLVCTAIITSWTQWIVI